MSGKVFGLRLRSDQQLAAAYLDAQAQAAALIHEMSVVTFLRDQYLGELVSRHGRFGASDLVRSLSDSRADQRVSAANAATTSSTDRATT